MKIKNLFTSIVGIFAAFTTHAAFATGEYENNETYSSACNVDVLGVSSGTKGATAVFEQIVCNAGEYLNVAGDDCSSCPAGYPNSLSGSDGEGSCYTSCVASDVAHAATVSGNKYANDTNTCAAATCVPGYTKQTVGPTLPTTGTNADSRTPASPDTNPANWTVTWTTSGSVHGTATGIWSCNDTSGTEYTADANLNATGGEQTGRNCWCKMTNWTPSGESAQDAESSWVFFFTMSLASECADYCAYQCGLNVQNNSTMRSGMFGSVAEKDVCVANTITINWGDGNNGTHESNTCTYGGDITTPTTAPTKRGYRFIGWVFE